MPVTANAGEFTATRFLYWNHKLNLEAWSIRGQTVHWILRKFCVCMFLIPVIKHVQVLSEWSKKTKGEQREPSCCGIHLQFTKGTIGLVVVFEKILKNIQKIWNLIIPKIIILNVTKNLVAAAWSGFSNLFCSMNSKPQIG